MVRLVPICQWYENSFAVAKPMHEVNTWEEEILKRKNYAKAKALQ